MKHFKAVGILIFLSWLAAIPITPPDPLTVLIAMAMIFLVAFVGYLMGIKSGRRLKEPI